MRRKSHINLFPAREFWDFCVQVSRYFVCALEQRKILHSSKIWFFECTLHIKIGVNYWKHYNLWECNASVCLEASLFFHSSWLTNDCVFPLQCLKAQNRLKPQVSSYSWAWEQPFIRLVQNLNPVAVYHVQTSNLKSFHPEILKKSNHILRPAYSKGYVMVIICKS